LDILDQSSGLTQAAAKADDDGLCHDHGRNLTAEMAKAGFVDIKDLGNKSGRTWAPSLATGDTSLSVMMRINRPLPCALRAISTV